LEQKEVETLVEELEVRVERLRALYDQYFMGIEKLEPAVPRKDVERRLYVLRRTSIRNTSLRFRFQNVLLRYNTYQTYWMRICRQIEEGTYKRDVRRANARFAKPPRRQEEPKSASREDAHDTEPPGPPDSLKELEAEDIDVDFDAPDEPPKPDWLEELQMRAVLHPTGLPRDLVASTPGSTPGEGQPPAGPKAPHNLEISTEREIWLGKSPQTTRNPQPTTRRSARPAVAQPPAALPMPAAKSPAVGGVRYAQPGKRSPSEVPPRAASPAVPRPLPAPPAPAPPPTARTGNPQSRASSAPPRRKSRPSIPKIEAAKPAKVAKGELSDERVRQIYTQYVDTKRSLKESTASLTYESLSKSLRDSSDMLRKKHGGKSVDFEVTVKDGKTILRPVVK
jgi:hypothetical protein